MCGKYVTTKVTCRLEVYGGRFGACRPVVSVGAWGFGRSTDADAVWCGLACYGSALHRERTSPGRSARLGRGLIQETPLQLCQRRISMSHQVRLEDDVYERIKSQKRDDETFSEAIDRLTSDWTLLDFAADPSPVPPDEHRALLDRSETTGIEDTKQRLERTGVDVDE